MGKRETQLRSKELLDVGAADIISLGDFYNTENLNET